MAPVESHSSIDFNSVLYQQTEIPKGTTNLHMPLSLHKKDLSQLPKMKAAFRDRFCVFQQHSLQFKCSNHSTAQPMFLCLSDPKFFYQWLMCALFDLPKSNRQDANIQNARTTDIFLCRCANSNIIMLDLMSLSEESKDMYVVYV